MGLLDILNHLLNFIAPAFAVAMLTAFLARRLVFTKGERSDFGALAVAGSVSGVTVLAAGLWMFGRDAMMFTYAAMAVACATTQWVLVRAWRG